MIRHLYICDRCGIDLLNPSKQVLSTWRHYTAGDLKIIVCPVCYKSLIPAVKRLVQDWLNGVGIDNTAILQEIFSPPPTLTTDEIAEILPGDDLPPAWP
jgi:hypothetical protein